MKLAVAPLAVMLALAAFSMTPVGGFSPVFSASASPLGANSTINVTGNMTAPLSGQAVLALVFGFGFIGISLLDRDREIWAVYSGFSWIAISVVVFLQQGLLWFILGIGLAFILIIEGSLRYAARGTT